MAYEGAFVKEFGPAEYEEVRDGARFRVWKVGGGTLGKRYPQEKWHVSVRDAKTNAHIWSARDMYIGSNASHEDVPDYAEDWMSA